MKRRWIKTKNIDPFDEMHKQTLDGFEVDEKKDGQSTEKHREGIDYIKKVLLKGQKILPILVYKEGEKYKKLDGFKRLMAHRELGKEIIECFICDNKDMEERKVYQFTGHPMTCCMGGQSFKDFRFPLFEGGENENPKDVNILFHSHILRIEIRENVHIHWGDAGKYRLEVGLRDFMILAKVFEEAEI